MSYVRLIPSMTEYSQKFRRLDSLDFKIIRAMYRHGISNLTKLASEVNVPQQTISYRVRRFDKRDLVRFRALLNEAKLGLRSYSVVAATPLDRERISSRAMTCFPLWRYLSLFSGWKHGNYVRYTVPPDKETDLRTFLEELQKRELINDFEIKPTASPKYPLLDLNPYIDKEGVPAFEWDKWVNDFDSFTEREQTETAIAERAKFDLYDLIVLRCLEIDGRMTQRKIVREMANIVAEKEYGKFIPLVSRRIRRNINSQGLIRGYRAYIFPTPEPTALFFMFHLSFSNNSSLRRFIGGLNHLPYNTAYDRILGENAMFIRFIIPVHEWPRMRRTFTDLAQTGHVKDSHLYFGDLAQATWDNVEIYQMFKDGSWNFSYGAAAEMLEKTLSGQPFRSGSRR